jgi:ribonuclease HII
MIHSIATDEAGYGPNLGPLAIGATRWTFPDAATDPKAILDGLVFDQKSQLNRFESEYDNPGLMIADSKAVYSSGKIELLERGVLGCLYTIHQTVPGNVGELLKLLQVDETQIQDADYFQSNDIGLPLKSDRSMIESAGRRLREKLDESGCSLEELAVTLVFPKQFNRGIEEYGNKASCLTAASLQLIAAQMIRADARSKDRFDIRCDKHGGRSHYAPAIQEQFNNTWVTIEEEGRPRSSYRFDDDRVVISFTAKGESWLPIALASMCAKYTRELFMLRWNRFWKTHLPHLKPTKGYPVDAKRFKKDIAKVQRKIGIPDEDIWRCR